AVAAIAPLHAQDSRRNLHIEAQPMRLALKDLGLQTGLSIVFRAEEATWSAVQAPRVEGALSAKEALETLLKGTGLTYQFVNETTVLVSSSKEVTTGDMPRKSDQLRVAQADGTQASTGAATPENKSPAAEATSLDANSGALNEIVVTAQKRIE